MPNAFYFQRLHYLLLLSLPILYFSNWSGQLCFPKTCRSSKQLFAGTWKHPTSISKESCFAGWSWGPKPSQLLKTLQLALKTIHKLTGIAKIAWERSFNYSCYQATGIQFWLLWPHILSIKWLWHFWCRQIHIAMRSLYWKISEKLQPLSLPHFPWNNITLANRKQNYKEKKFKVCSPFSADQGSTCITRSASKAVPTLSSYILLPTE